METAIQKGTPHEPWSKLLRGGYIGIIQDPSSGLLGHMAPMVWCIWSLRSGTGGVEGPWSQDLSRSPGPENNRVDCKKLERGSLAIV